MSKEQDEKIKLVPCNSCNKHTIFKCPKCHGTGFVQDPTTILCNNCGGCMCPIGTFNEQIPHGLYNAEVTGGYDSDYLLDLETYKFSLCEKCLFDMFKLFKIKPKISDYLNGEVYPFDRSVRVVEYNLWRKAGNHKVAYEKGLCNAVKDCNNEAKYSVYYDDDDVVDTDCACEEHKDDLILSIGSSIRPFVKSIFRILI